MDPTAGLVDEFRRLEVAILSAVQGREWADLDRLLADDFLITTAGWISEPASKASWLDALEAHGTLDEFEIHSVDLRRVGDGVVVLLLSTQSGVLADTPYTYNFRYTDVWRADESRQFQLVVRHASIVSERASR
jgi:hypothetical protein